MDQHTTTKKQQYIRPEARRHVIRHECLLNTGSPADSGYQPAKENNDQFEENSSERYWE